MLGHRGPDDAGEWWSEDGQVGLGHRRLAVIDLSPSGHQPMQDIAGELCIVFNGEIYNFMELRKQLAGRGHSFRSRSDTEVILAAYREWGFDCLLHLNGMFVFALYDKRYQRVFLARDRAGEKPLFYAIRNGTLRFASELKGLMADSTLERRIDHDALDCFLAMGFVPGYRCIVKDIHKLPPAHALQFDLRNGIGRVWRYWELPAPPEGSQSRIDERDEAALLDELEALLEDAVRLQLVADVPVGVLLSGGVDSSLITAMAARASGKVKTFTVGFPDFGKYDETIHARLIAGYFGTRHFELNSGRVDPGLLSILARQYDEPMIDSSMIPTYLVSQLVRQHCTVALGGDGGDELFGGYPHYKRLLWIKERLSWIPGAFKNIIANTARLVVPVGFTGRNWLTSFTYDSRTGMPLIGMLFDAAERRRLLGEANCSGELVAELVWNSRVPVTDDLLQRATRMEFENYMAEDILVKVDRASMYHSLELRAPLLDYRVIEFAFGRIPSKLKATATQTKILLKKLAARLLPAEFNYNRKQGFSIPLADWLKHGPWRDRFLEVLLEPQCSFSREAITSLIRGQDRGMNNQERLFGLVLFELWRREYQIEM